MRLERPPESSGHRASNSDLPDYAFHLLATIERLRDLKLDEALQVIDLSVNRYRALRTLARLGSCTMSDLARANIVDRTTLTRLVDQLVRKGLVERQRTDVDRRRVLVSLTETGRSLHRCAAAVVARHNRDTLRDIPEALQWQWTQIQQQLVVALSPDARTAASLLAPPGEPVDPLATDRADRGA